MKVPYKISKTLFLHLILMFFLFLSSASWAQENSDFPSVGLPGSLVKIDFGKSMPPGERLVLLDKDRAALVSAEIFSFGGSFQALLALPSTLSPGDYSLAIQRGNGLQLVQQTFQVRERDFKEEVIPLNASLTTLRDSKSAEKRSEALEIQALYGRFSPEAVYGSLQFLSPIEAESLDYFRISAHYGDRRTYKYNDAREVRSIHTGIDLAAREGTPILACDRGRVVLAKDRIISGQSIVIEHLPGVYSIYFHLKETMVTEGQMVEKGEKIGTVGMSGLATGPHLHWELRVNGIPVDPSLLTDSFPD